MDNFFGGFDDFDCFGLSRFELGLDLTWTWVFVGLVSDGAVQNRQKETADERWRAVWL